MTSRINVGTLVFGNDYWHPVVLSKEFATLDKIAEGRVEFGLGADWMRTDYDHADMTYDRRGVVARNGDIVWCDRQPARR